MQTDNALLNNAEAAKVLGVSAGTLRVWTCRNRYGVPFLKVGRLTKFRPSDLQEWLASRARGGNAPSPRRRRRSRQAK